MWSSHRVARGSIDTVRCITFIVDINEEAVWGQGLRALARADSRQLNTGLSLEGRVFAEVGRSEEVVACSIPSRQGCQNALRCARAMVSRLHCCSRLLQPAQASHPPRLCPLLQDMNKTQALVPLLRERSKRSAARHCRYRWTNSVATISVRYRLSPSLKASCALPLRRA